MAKSREDVLAHGFFGDVRYWVSGLFTDREAKRRASRLSDMVWRIVRDHPDAHRDAPIYRFSDERIVVEHIDYYTRKACRVFVRTPEEDVCVLDYGDVNEDWWLGPCKVYRQGRWEKHVEALYGKTLEAVGKGDLDRREAMRQRASGRFHPVDDAALFPEYA